MYKYLFACLLLARVWLVDAQNHNSKNIFIDTDLFSDVGDAAAILLAATHPSANLLGIALNTHSTYSALAASALAATYSHPNLPIGFARPYDNSSFHDTWAYAYGEFASKVAYHYKGGSVPWFRPEKTWDPVELYRKKLAETPKDKHVTLISLGFLSNLSALLNSTADKHSPLPGRQLVEAKVDELVVMGGSYEKGSGPEYNFAADNPAHAAHVVNTWPARIPLTFSGAELGEKVSVGARFSVKGTDEDPVRNAFEWYAGYNTSVQSWDTLTVMYALKGLDSWFEYGGVGGRNVVDARSGANTWKYDGNRERLGSWKPVQRFLKLKIGSDKVAAELEDLLIERAKLGRERLRG